MASVQFTEGGEHAPVFVDQVKQLLPNVVDGMARTRPEAVYALIPRSFTTYEEGFRKVTYRQLANAVNGVAWILSEHLGTGTSAEPLAYVGPNDIGYIAVILGASKAGYSILSPSPRNTPADHASLFAATRCKTIVTLAPPYAPAVVQITEGVDHPPRIVHVPNVFALLDTRYRHYPYPHTFAAIKDTPLAIVHTSGTTGTPKPLTYTHGSAASFIRELREPAPEGHYNLISLVESNRVFAMFPFFHAGSLFVALFDGIASQTIVVTPLAGVPPSVEGLIQALKHVDVDTLLLPAPFVDQIAKNPETFAFIASRVSTIGYGGADISKSAGDAFAAAHILAASYYGSTETMTIPGIRPHEDFSSITDWQYVQPHPYVNASFEPTSQPDLFEMLLTRNPDPARVQPVFTVFPHLDVYRTRDLWSPHPSKPDLWLYRGRADDVIVAATGEMCNPLQFEQALSSLAEVNAVLVLGAARYRKALLIEPAAHEREAASTRPEEFLERLWPAIEKANDLLSATSRVARDHLLITDADRPMLRAGKGTVQRAPTLKLYAERIQELYEVTGDGVRDVERPLPVHIELPAE